MRDHVKRKTVELRYCPTDDMLADIMKKALAKDRHVKLCGLIGMNGSTWMENTTPSSFKVTSEFGNSEELPENDEWECGIAPFSARTMDAECATFG